MFAATIQHQPSSLVSRVGQAATQTAGTIFVNAALTEDILPGEGIVLHVTGKAVNAWSAMFGPDDVNGQKTISGQNSAGQLGGFNVTGNSVGGAAVHLISFHSAGGRLASGTNFQAYINTGGACIFSVFRIRGNARLQNYENVGGALTAGVVYSVGNINRQGGAAINSGSNTRGSLGGYRRNMAFLQCSSTFNNSLQDGVASFFSLQNSTTFASGTLVGQSAQRWDLHYVPFNTALLYRQNITANAVLTSMSFVI